MSVARRSPMSNAQCLITNAKPSIHDMQNAIGTIRPVNGDEVRNFTNGLMKLGKNKQVEDTKL
jgi:hypothetical protein